MKKKFVATPVKDGWVKRDAKTGRFVAAGTAKGTFKATSETRSVLRDTSARRTAALKRLADR